MQERLMQFSMYVGYSVLSDGNPENDDKRFPEIFRAHTPPFLTYSHYEYEMPLVVGKFSTPLLLQN